MTAEIIVCVSNSYIFIISAIPGLTCEEAVLDNPCGDFTICVSVEGATCSCNQTGYELQTDNNCTGKVFTQYIFGGGGGGEIKIKICITHPHLHETHTRTRKKIFHVESEILWKMALKLGSIQAHQFNTLLFV